jgi:hypothetical protein
MRYRVKQLVNVKLVEARSGEPEYWTRGLVLQVPAFGSELYKVDVNGRGLWLSERQLEELDLGTVMLGVIGRVARTMGLEEPEGGDCDGSLDWNAVASQERRV